MFFIRATRSFIAAVLIVAALCSLAGCSSGGPKLDPKNPVTIVVWHYYHGAQKNAFDSAVMEFNATLGYEKGIIVEAVGHGGVDELAANVIAAAKGELDAGTLPNVFGTYGDTALEILNMGLLSEINAYLTEAELAEYEDSFIHEGQLGTENLYVFPIAKSTESLMLNKTDFDAFAAGLKSAGWAESAGYADLATWEGILKIADLYYRYTDSLTPDTEQDGRAFMGIDSLANYIIVASRQLGQDLVTVSGGKASIQLDGDIMERIWHTYYDATVTGKFIKLGRFCSDDIKTGDTICYIGSTSSATYFPMELTADDDDPRRIEMLVLPMPVFERGDDVAISQGAGMAVAKSSPEKEYASVLFLKWFTESERNVLFSLASSYLPVKVASLEDSLLDGAFRAMEKDDDATQNTIQALRVGIEQLRTYTLYSSEVFDGGTDFRLNLPTGLSDAALEGRTAYRNALEDGLSPADALALVSEQSLPAFQKWLDSLEKWGS